MGVSLYNWVQRFFKMKRFYFDKGLIQSLDVEIKVNIVVFLKRFLVIISIILIDFVLVMRFRYFVSVIGGLIQDLNCKINIFIVYYKVVND